MFLKLFTLPMKAVIKLGEKIKEEVDRELYDVDFIQHQLIQLEMLWEMGEITEEYYEKKEAELLQRYEIAREKELGNWDNEEEEL